MRCTSSHLSGQTPGRKPIMILSGITFKVNTIITISVTVRLPQGNLIFIPFKTHFLNKKKFKKFTLVSEEKYFFKAIILRKYVYRTTIIAYLIDVQVKYYKFYLL